MTSARSLPIRFEPIAGEAIDSYLEAYAARLDVPWHDWCTSVRVDTASNDLCRWLIHLSRCELTGIQNATGISAEQAQTMTLSAYDGRAVQIDRNRRTPVAGFPWGYTSTCRFCPQCLAATGGRWQLKWRLSWSFACLEHSCLLADCCPRCERPQRVRPHLGGLVPRPGRCANARPGSLERMSQRCDADLSSGSVQHFDAHHAVPQAQRLVYELIDDIDPEFAVYRGAKHSSREVLGDIRAIARRAILHPTVLHDLVPDDLLAQYPVALARRQPVKDPSLASPRQAVAVAVGVTAAVASLSRSNVYAAGESLRWIAHSPGKRNAPITPTILVGRAETTPTLTSVFLSALAPTLGPAEQLRYCIATEPKPPFTSTAPELHKRAARIPTMLWPAWSLRLCIGGLRPRLTRQCLSVIVAYAGSQLTFEEAAGLIQAPVGRWAVSPVLRALYANDWTSISTALTRLAEYLVTTEVPIDYRRRRRLNYSTLLPDESWQEISRRHTRAINSVNGRIARSYLFERLSGMPASLAPIALSDKRSTLALANFPCRLNIELRQALDQYCVDWLKSRRIVNEPITWHPDLAIVSDLDLPGPDPHEVDLKALQDMVLQGARRPQVIADDLGTTVEIVRYLLDEYPVVHLCEG